MCVKWVCNNTNNTKQCRNSLSYSGAWHCACNVCTRGRVRFKPGDPDRTEAPKKQAPRNATMKGLVRTKGGQFGSVKKTRANTNRKDSIIEKLRDEKVIANRQIAELEKKLRDETGKRRLFEQEVEDLEEEAQIASTEIERLSEEVKTMKKRMKEIERSKRWYESSRKGVATVAKRKVAEMQRKVDSSKEVAANLEALLEEAITAQDDQDLNTNIHMPAHAAPPAPTPTTPTPAPAAAPTPTPTPTPTPAPAPSTSTSTSPVARKLGTAAGLDDSKNPTRDVDRWAQPVKDMLAQRFKSGAAGAQRDALLKCLRDLEVQYPWLVGETGEGTSAYRFRQAIGRVASPGATPADALQEALASLNPVAVERALPTDVENSIVFAAEEAIMEELEEIHHPAVMFNLKMKNMSSRRQYNRMRLLLSSVYVDGRWVRKRIGRSSMPLPMLPSHGKVDAVQTKIDDKFKLKKGGDGDGTSAYASLPVCIEADIHYAIKLGKLVVGEDGQARCTCPTAAPFACSSKWTRAACGRRCSKCRLRTCLSTHVPTPTRPTTQRSFASSRVMTTGTAFKRKQSSRWRRSPSSSTTQFFAAMSLAP